MSKKQLDTLCVKWSVYPIIISSMQWTNIQPRSDKIMVLFNLLLNGSQLPKIKRRFSGTLNMFLLQNRAEGVGLSLLQVLKDVKLQFLWVCHMWDNFMKNSYICK